MINVEDLKLRHPIAEVIAAHGVELAQRGRRLTGSCPFHDDRSPSFVVYQDTQSFYCFGCGAAGDVIDFVQRNEGVGFREAIERIDARAAGLPVLPVHAPHAPRPPARLSLDDRLILTAACELYHEALLANPGILQYLATRGVDERVARRARIGFSDGRILVPYLKRRRLSLRRAEELGLLFRDGAETMAQRVVIPDLRGAHCGWMVGRVVDGLQEPRYRGLALPRPLLGYDRARDHDRIFLTEGPFDWLTLTGWGLPACALLGTQASARALHLLDRARSIVLVLDSDEPGSAGAAKLAQALGDRASVVALPSEVKDVNQLAQQAGGRETFFRLLDQAQREQKGATRNVAQAR